MSGGEWTTCEGPDRCCDDLCRGNDYGICGVPSAHLFGEDCGDPDCDRCGDDDYPDYGFCPGCGDRDCPWCGEDDRPLPAPLPPSEDDDG